MSIQNITGLIGNTSLLKIEDKVQYYAKIEGSNSFGSAIGAGFVPRNLIYTKYDDYIIVEEINAVSECNKLISKGIVIGASKNRNYSSLCYIQQLQIGMSRAAG